MDIKLNVGTVDIAMLIALTTLGRRYGDYELSNWCKEVRRQLIDQLGHTEVTLDTSQAPLVAQAVITLEPADENND